MGVLTRIGALCAGIAVFTTPVSAQENDDPMDGQDEVRIQRWRGHFSQYQQAIATLPQERVAFFTIPILFGVDLDDLSDNFGEARGGGTRLHEGLDIMAPRGTPLVSPTDAVVLRTGSGTNSGLYVYTINPGGETFVYMHLDRIAEGLSVGERIGRGRIVGFTGDSGNAIGAGTHLHFEVRSQGATDPLPRITSVWNDVDIAASLADLATRSPADAQYMANLVGRQLKVLETRGVLLPSSVASLIANVTAAPASTPRVVSTIVAEPTPGPNDDLELGDDGPAVVALQKALIAADAGPAAQYLGRSGATGYFGAITRDALIEYQNAQAISPASGFYGPKTRASLAGTTPAMANTAPTVAGPTAVSTTAAFTRDLELGMNGEDVRALQKYLNARGHIVAASGSGSVGNETAYFGPATRAALIAYQSAQGIAPAAGYFGPKTRASVNQRGG